MRHGVVIALLLVLLVALTAAPPMLSHEGPPYPILVSRPTGPVLLSVWADPDVGIGTFHVYLQPLGEEHRLPAESSVRILVQPVDGRLAERGHDAEPYRADADRHHLIGEVPFDAVGDWRVKLVVRGAGEEGEARTVVAVTPPGQGPVLDFILYLSPFVLVGILIVRKLIASRRAKDTA